MAATSSEKPKLKQVLRSGQIFFIVITVVIGSGVFNDYGSAAQTAGPGGMLIAFFIVSLLAIGSMDGLSEMIQLFPTVNPIVELVHEFVDVELARLTGFAYWFAYASFTAVQFCRAAKYLDFYAGPSAGWEFGKIVTFYILAPILTVLLNVTDVKVFGYVESTGGVIKLFILTTVIIMCFYLAGEGHGASFFEEGVKRHLDGGRVGSALCLSIEFVAFSFCGIEAIAVTTFEAKEISDLRWPSQWITPVTFVFYLLSAISQGMLVDWKKDTDVPGLDGPLTSGYGWVSGAANSTGTTPIIAAVQNNNHGLAKAMNAMFMFCALSAANSTLYVSSRMLYGLAYINSLDSPRRIWKQIAYVNGSGVPINAVFLSAGAFIWVPLTQISSTEATARLMSWFNNAGCLCVIFVWGTINLAYLRYYLWFRRFKHSVLSEPEYQRLNRQSKDKGFFTLLSRAQPFVSILAWLGSYTVVFIFASAYLWRTTVHANSFFQYYTVPLLLPTIWLLLKFYAYTKLVLKHRPREGNAEWAVLEAMSQAWHELAWRKDTSRRLRDDIEATIENLTIYLKPGQKTLVDRLLTDEEMNEPKPDDSELSDQPK